MTPGDDQYLHALEHETFSYFSFHACPTTGLTRDYSSPESNVSIAATGMAFACCAIAAERGFISRDEAIRRVWRAIDFLLHAPQGPEANASGYKGFFYHFISGHDGRRAGHCELSTIDTALLIAGALIAGSYFNADHPVERKIRHGAEELYARVDWQWALAGGASLCHGFKPETGFLQSRWEGYSEALFMYVMALGSPTRPLCKSAYEAFTSEYRWLEAYGIGYLHATPLFIHQLSHCWLDLQHLRDRPMRRWGLDYFENSRRATLLQQRYAIANPGRFALYGENAFGLTACCGPGPRKQTIDGVEREFLGYTARGTPNGPDDGTLAPWAVAASLPFAPETIMKVIKNYDSLKLRERSPHGFHTTFNPTLVGRDGSFWSTRAHYGLNQGPLVIMVENQRSRLPWKLSRRMPGVRAGLLAAGFEGGWLTDDGA